MFSLPIRVYYEDTDVGGVVYYANYLKFMERARTEYLRDVGFDQSAIARELGCQFVVRSVAMDLYKPARLDDELDVQSHIEHYGRASLLFRQQLIRQTNSESTRLCTAKIKIACVDATSFKPTAIPVALADALKKRQ